MQFYGRVLSYFRRDIPLILLILALIVISLGVGLLQAWPAGIMADMVLMPRENRDWVHRLFAYMLSPLPDRKLPRIIGVALIGMALKIVQDSVAMTRNMLNNRLRYNGMTRARRDLFVKLMDLSPAYHKGRPQGDAIYRVCNDVWGIFGVLDQFIATSASLITPLAMIGVMASLNIRMTLIALAITPPLFLANLYFSKTIKRTSLDFKRTDTDLTTAVQRSMASVGLIQLFGRQRCELTKFETSVDRTVRTGMRMNWQEQLYPLAVQTVFALGGAAIFGYGGYLVYRDQQRGAVNGFTIGAVIAYMAYLGQLWDPISRLIGFRANIQGHVASCERVFQVLDEQSKISDAVDAKSLPLRPRTLTLHNVGFGYGNEIVTGVNDGEELVLRGITARIAPGQMVAFVGASGAGKSTLLHLLPRFYDPTSGALTLDGHNLRQVKVDDVRRHVALVPQDSQLLPTSIAENIAYGRPEASLEEIRAAAEAAGAVDFIERLPDGYNTVITEGGQNLSGGQRQRLAIARALLTESPILVLDEPTSSQDPTNERTILKTLRGLKRRRTVVLVTHRLDTVQDCDQIFVLDSGRIVERGTHQELLEARGHYFSLLGSPVAA